MSTFSGSLDYFVYLKSCEELVTFKLYSLSRDNSRQSHVTTSTWISIDVDSIITFFVHLLCICIGR